MEVEADIMEFFYRTNAGDARGEVGVLARTRDGAGAACGAVSAGQSGVGRPATGAGSRPRSRAEMKAGSGRAGTRGGRGARGRTERGAGGRAWDGAERRADSGAWG